MKILLSHSSLKDTKSLLCCIFLLILTLIKSQCSLKKGIIDHKSSHTCLHMIVCLLSTLVRACYTNKGLALVCDSHNFVTTRNVDMIRNTIFDFWLICNFISLWIFFTPLLTFSLVFLFSRCTFTNAIKDG